jgi:hypothetical protein
MAGTSVCAPALHAAALAAATPAAVEWRERKGPRGRAGAMAMHARPVERPVPRFQR